MIAAQGGHQHDDGTNPHGAERAPVVGRATMIRLDQLPLTEGESLRDWDDPIVTNAESVCLSRWYMPKLGPLSQTLGMLYGTSKLNDKKTTFIAATTIADKLDLSLRTVHNHLEALAEQKLIIHLGRKEMPGSKLKRRSVTYAVNPFVHGFYGTHNYNRLPLFMCRCIPKWSERAVFAEIFDRILMQENMEFGEVRDIHSIGNLQKRTGLTRKSIVDAKRWLYSTGITKEWGEGWRSTNSIILSDDCKVVVRGEKPVGIRKVKQ